MTIIISNRRLNDETLQVQEEIWTFSVKSQASFANDIISNLCRFNNNNKKKKKEKKKKNHNNDTKTLLENLMLKNISHAPVSDVFSDNVSI